MFEELAVSPTITTQLLAHTEYGVRSKFLVHIPQKTTLIISRFTCLWYG
jgi:hypothetical protein